MLSSLPPLGPHDAHALWYPSLSTHRHPPSDSQLQINSNHNNPNHPIRLPQSQPPHLPSRTLLSVLRADENAIVNRKANIRRFGAGWLRPPGVPKTLQGMWDERAEREEQEAVALRETAMMEAQAAAEAEAEAGGARDMIEDGEGEGEAQERDLDEEIPDAEDGQEGWVDEEDDDEEDGMPTEEGDGDYAEGEGLDGREETTGRDLDEDVPEAGSYQHTDTELEDDSSGEEGDGRFVRTSLGEVRGVGGVGGVLGSSVFGSSPIVRVPGERRSSGRGRDRGREN